MSEITNAAGAYQNALKNLGGESAKKTGDNAFGDMVKNSLEGAIDAQKVSERTTSAAVEGNADTIDVLQAVTEAETTLNTVLAVRDRLVSAYQEIMRMPI